MSARTGWIAATVSVVCAFVVIGALVDALAPAPQGPALSSYATSPSGVAGWDELLAREGHRVTQLRGPVTATSLPADATFVVLEGSGSGAGGVPTSGAAAALVSRFVADGGWLVVTGQRARVSTAGRGRIEVLSNPDFLENRELGDGDHALRALALAGPAGREVVFDEAIHGYGPAIGLAALPTRWWVAIALLALAAAGLILSRWVRLGGAEPVAPEPPSSRRAYVSAMAATLARTRDRADLDRLAAAAAAREQTFERSL
jgi:hypothetical protein